MCWESCMCSFPERTQTAVEKREPAKMSEEDLCLMMNPMPIIMGEIANPRNVGIPNPRPGTALGSMCHWTKATMMTPIAIPRKTRNERLLLVSTRASMTSPIATPPGKARFCRSKRVSLNEYAKRMPSGMATKETAIIRYIEGNTPEKMTTAATALSMVNMAKAAPDAEA